MPQSVMIGSVGGHLAQAGAVLERTGPNGGDAVRQVDGYQRRIAHEGFFADWNP